MIRVASIPASHPYVGRVLPDVVPDPGYPALPLAGGTPAGDGPAAARLPDPVPDVADPKPGQWWPARMLEADWLHEHVGLVDVVHLHFGFEGRSTPQLRDWLAALADADLPVVLTVHDLVNPHLTDQTDHQHALDVLVPAADVVLTLTPGAAKCIRRCWGVDATAVPHPQILDDAEILASGHRATGEDSPRIGVHLGGMRTNVTADPWLPALLEIARAQGAVVEVLVNDEVPADHPVLERFRSVIAGTDADARLRSVPRMGDSDLHHWIRSLDVAALPYGHGTHSGWLEMCWDAGVSVLAPPVGQYAEQHPDAGFLAELSPAGLAERLAALLAARRHTCPWGTPEERVAARRATAARVRKVHEAAYTGLVR